MPAVFSRLVEATGSHSVLVNGQDHLANLVQFFTSEQVQKSGYSLDSEDLVKYFNNRMDRLSV